jgi:hypothetical protein
MRETSDSLYQVFHKVLLASKDLLNLAAFGILNRIKQEQPTVTPQTVMISTFKSQLLAEMMID